MKTISNALMIFTISFFSVLFAIKYENVNRGDPDRYYHYAVSKITAQTFAPMELPQVDDLGWNKFFVEKEFLFHVYTGLAYKIDAENGVKLACLGLGFFILLLVCNICKQTTPSWLAIVITLLICASSERFITRMFTVRPHVLATLICLGILWAVLEKRMKLIAFLSFLFALSYHALYLPLIISGASIVSSSILSKSVKSDSTIQSLKLCLYTFGGLVVGAIVNPYFPGNLVIGFQHLKIAFVSTGLPIRHFGAELLPYDGTTFIKNLIGFMGVFLLATIWSAYKYKAPPVTAQDKNLEPPTPPLYQIYTLMVLTLFFLLVSLHNPRGIEFLVPFTAILISRISPLIQKQNFVTPVFCLLVFGVQMPGNKVLNFKNVDFDKFSEEDADRHAAKLASNSIPNDPAKTKVFNCNWDVSPYVFYARPDLKFVDLLDPSLLYAQNKDKYDARSKWQTGGLPDSWGAFKDGFKADYVFCRVGDSSRFLASDPHFNLLYPKGTLERSKAKFEVYALANQRREEFVTEFSYSKDLAKIDIEAFEAKREPLALDGMWPPAEFASDSKPVFMDLFAATGFIVKESSADNAATVSGQKEEDKKPYKYVCAEVSPSKQEIARLKGTSMIGLGGGPYLELWVDRHRVYKTKSLTGSRKIIHTLVPLDKAITSSTELKLTVCGTDAGSYLGTSISMWTPEQMTQVCKEKWLENSDFQTTSSETKSDFSDIECIANLARK